MRTMLLGFLGLLAGLCPSMDAHAANPELLARVQGIDDPKAQRQSLRISDLELDVDLVGALADVTLTARFANPSKETLEGDFSFELPAGAVVTGYALDIEGRMIDGVLVDPLKAERTYEARVRQGIDPGVAKVSRANVFSTRVFPIPGNGARTIRLTFSAPVHGTRGLGFPLVTEGAVGKHLLTVRSTGLQSAPGLTLPNERVTRWQSAGEGWTARTILNGVPLSGELRIAPVQARHGALETRHHNGERSVHVVDAASRVQPGRTTGRRLRVYWDRSLSRRDQQLEAERALLGSYLAASRPASIDLVVFNSTGASVSRESAQNLDARLRALTYRGATSYAVLEKLDAPRADVCLMFTDGVATIDARRDFTPGCEMFVITSAADADRGFLLRLAAGLPDAVLQLRGRERDEVLARLMGGAPRVVQVLTEDGRELPFTSLEGGTHGWSVIVQAPANGAVILRIAGLRTGVVERRYSPFAARAATFDAAGALWAAERAAQLAAEDGAHDAFVAFSRRFSIASAGLSFLVLEQPSDYVAAGIAPPANYPAEWLEAYRELAAEQESEQRDARSARLTEVLAQWQEVIRWWNARFDPQAKPKKAEARLRTPQASAAAVVDSITAEDIGSFPDAATQEALQRVSGYEADEVVVTGLRASLQASVEAKRTMELQRTIGVQIAEWDVTRPYIEALDAASKGDEARVFAAQEREFGALPAFYFDVAEWLQRRQRPEEAVEMLLSALELPVANEETASMVADRLLRYGRADRAIWLLERAAAQSDYLPQPRRSLALALASRAGLAERAGERASARADLERAVRLLDEVVMTPWEGNYDGIEMIALMEANSLLPRLETLGVRRPPLDERLRALLDVDLRVVIEWNTGASDMDLWVDEPNGERAIYSNPRTAIGGRLSNDMTHGYGPEEYLLRRSATGEYRISVHVYRADVINPNGSTVITARLFRDFGRPGQSEQTMEIELTPGDSGEKLVGTFTVQ